MGMSRYVYIKMYVSQTIGDLNVIDSYPISSGL